VWGRESSSPDIGSAGDSIGDDGQKLYHSRILETHLTDCHASILLKVGPRRIDDCDVIFLVPWQNVNGHVHLLQQALHLPSMEFALVSCAQSVKRSSGMASHVSPSFIRR
jgi:hypothetical protein